ncbi:hypothetical protein HPB47_014111 [Ixodes persulcatus]|uniref:Uncharacterized protein n=1 Tax=Ixodes persulcatus TaxID=34615 RepID=A0AC60QXP2_IXOPE|nr:hypothetical protein HPB47_014111 [Ixodes persulcatus]
MPRISSEDTLTLDVNPLYRIPLVAINCFILVASFGGLSTATYSLYYRFSELSLTGGSVLITVAVNLEIPILSISFVTFIVSFVGFFGALRENKTLLRCYIRLLTNGMFFVLLVAMVIAGIPFISKNTLQSLVSVELVERYRDNADYRQLIDSVQEKFECCGVTEDGYKDWNQNIYLNCSRSNPSAERCFVPSSCCQPMEVVQDLEAILKRRFCGQDVLKVSEQEAWERVYQRNCVDALVKTMRGNLFVVFAVTLIILAALIVMRFMGVCVNHEIVVVERIYKKHYKGVLARLAKAKARREKRERSKSVSKDVTSRSANTSSDSETSSPE